MLLIDLDRMGETIYKDKLKERIDKMLGSWTVDMQPRRYRRLYRDKAYKQEFSLPAANPHASSTLPVDNPRISRDISPSRGESLAVSHDNMFGLSAALQALEPQF